MHDEVRTRDQRRVLLATVVVAAAWNLLANLVVPHGWYVPANLAAAALLVAGARRSGLTWTELGLDRRDAARGLRLGLAATALVASVLALALAVAQLVPGAAGLLEDEVVAADPTTMRWFRPLVRIPLGTVVFEELLFRSVLFGSLLRLRGATAAILGTSVLFGLWHVVPAWERAVDTDATVAGAVLVTVLVTTVASVLFALLRRRSGSVLAPVLAHVATNSLGYAATLVHLHLTD